MAIQTNSFKISRYILLALVLILCIGIITWTLVSKNRVAQSDTTVDNVIRITNNDPCIQNVNSIVAQMWAYDEPDIPQKYRDMITQYLDTEITSRIDGMCNDVKFVCRPGQLRRDCDPCATGSARQFAMEKQISDMIAEQCK